jgi:DNA helicase-2/ATP-dependent DNA helicase PcrA
MTISPEIKQLLEQEEQILDTVLVSLRAQIVRGAERLQTESVRARDLTSEIVATRRAEEKAMLASDEAVSHGLREQKQEEMQSLAKIIAKPYFARLVLEEEVNGSLKQFDYKIGFAANTDCRIIDWRKAPISKLYYEYRESDEYSEEIQGKERVGKVVLRNTVEIEKEKLKKVTCRHGTFLKSGNEWQGLGKSGARGSGGVRGLPHILSLITPEQFRTITEEASTAILIQGIAGSGKTTVALHRLAWLLHKDNSDVSAEKSVVIVFSKALKRYVSGTLPSIDINGVDVLTFAEWAARAVAGVCPHLLADDGSFRRPFQRPSSSIERVKRSLALLRCVEEVSASASVTVSPEDLVLKVLANPRRLIELDETRLLTLDLVEQAKRRAEENKTHAVIDVCDDALLVRATQLLTGAVFLKGGAKGRYGHIVADEVQDMSPAELAAVIGAVEKASNLTLVGDVAQKVESSSMFPGWEKLRASCSLKDTMSKYISLDVSHRSTLPIMRLADHVQERQLVTQGRQGRAPIWFRCDAETKGITCVIDWLTKAIERFPDALTAVICATAEEAKQAFAFLTPSFGSSVRRGSESDFSFEEGIVVTDAAQAKGLEFTNVLLWNPSRKEYPRDERARNLLYIAITRAEENLCLVTWDTPSALLPTFGSKLLRNFDMIEEKEAEEPEERFTD